MQRLVSQTGSLQESNDVQEKGFCHQYLLASNKSSGKTTTTEVLAMM